MPAALALALGGVAALGVAEPASTGDVAAPATAPAPAPAPAGVDRAATGRPNIVVVTTDDMRADDLAYMPRTRRLIDRLDLGEFVSNHPLCCPARAELLTGQLAQHNGVHHNTGRIWGGYRALRGKNNTLPRWLQRAGYDTALVGKFLNGWAPSTTPRPAGWADFMPLVRNAYSAYHYFYLDDGRVRAAPRGVHTNDFVTVRTLRRVQAQEAADRRPFFIWSSYVAPHDMTNARGRFGPPVPARRHRGTMSEVVLRSESTPTYRTPSPRTFARSLAEDAPADYVQPRVSAVDDESIRRLNQARLESLQSVDEGVGRLVRKLQRLGELRRTVLVFLSDNGYLLGEHGRMGKNSYYEEALRVPLLARGPGVAALASDKGSMVTDVAPSLGRIARADRQRAVDGRADLFTGAGGWPALLIQAGTTGRPWLWRGVRTDRWTYAELGGGSTRLFDRVEDPHERHNLSGQRPLVERALRAELAQLTR